MKRKSLVFTIASVAVVLALLLAGCGPVASPSPSATVAPSPSPSGTATPPPPTSAPESTYNALSPRGIALPVTILGLAERLDTIKGKTIFIRQGEADPVIMPALYEYAKANYPDTDWVYYLPTSGFGSTTPDATEVASAKAIIRGIGW